MQPTTTTHVASSTLATAATMVFLAMTHKNVDDVTLSYILLLANTIAMGLHPLVLAAYARMLAWLQAPKAVAK